MSLRRHVADLAVAVTLFACIAAPVSYALAQNAPTASTAAPAAMEQVQERNIRSLNQLEQDRAQEQIRLEAEYRNDGDAAFARYAQALKDGAAAGGAKQAYLEDLAAAQRRYEGALAELDRRVARDRAALVAQEGDAQAQAARAARQ